MTPETILWIALSGGVLAMIGALVIAGILLYRHAARWYRRARWRYDVARWQAASREMWREAMTDD